MNHTAHLPALVAILGLSAANPVFPQAPRNTVLWAGAGIGPTHPYDVGIVATVALRHNRMVVRARYASAGEFAGDWYEDLGLLIGLVVTPSSTRNVLALSAGVGRARCRHCGSLASQPDPEPATGFLLDAEGRLALTRGFGLAAYAFGDFNSSRSFGGVAVGLSIDRL